MTRHFASLSVVAVVVAVLTALNREPLAAAPAETACTIDALQRLAPAGTTITGVNVIEAVANVPRYCQVDGFVATPGNAVNFRLGLPRVWNRKFYFSGIGGFAGAFGALGPGLERGYASASTDTGHQSTVRNDATWALNNDAKRIDYAYRGTHVTAVAAKSVSEGYYGATSAHAYFIGCSNGGRQALLEAQRYPEDFDGIIAGDPSFGTLGQIRRTLQYQVLLSSVDHYLPVAKISLLSKAVVASCDARDGLEDGLITDPRACNFLPETLKCSGADNPNCLTAGQVETVQTIYKDMQTPDGRILPGYPVGHEDGPSGWQAWITGAVTPIPQADGRLSFGENAPNGYRYQDGYLRYLAFETHNPLFDWRTFTFARDWTKLQALAPNYSPTDPNLTKLQQRGGKLILYHGWADPAISASGTVAYYERVVQSLGREKANDTVRLFMAPGMHHCKGNGPGPNTFDVLTALEQWVERGTAPTRLIASHAVNGVVDRTRPLCAYPQVARYNGSGDINAAEHFRCEAPTQDAQR